MDVSKVLCALLFVILIASCTNERYKTVVKTDANGFLYEEVTNDPAKTRVYQLDNGLKVYLSANADEPRIKTRIIVKSGSLSDPKDATGLAHYFEHLLFKGSDEFGTLDWEKEKPLIDSIALLFEKHRFANTKKEKQEIYTSIDRLSYRASQYAIPNEYDKMMGAIGASGTNAGTSYEFTRFENEIPSNEVDRWLEIEYERFSDPVLRLFHTELETVYEEFNMSQDKDERRLMEEVLKNVFKKNGLGKSILGTPEDLKNPSLVRIKEFYETWYVPNNMAIIMSGDLNPDELILKIEKSFGKMKAKELPQVTFEKEPAITSPVVRDIYGPSMEMFYMVYRFEGKKSDDRLFVTMIDMLLNNRVAGLIDLDLIQGQKALYAGCTPIFYNDYGMHLFYGVPRAGQTLKETRELVLGEIEKIKKGEFDNWLMEAVVNDLRLMQISTLEGNTRVDFYSEAFVSGISIADNLMFLNRLDRLTKAELIAFAREHYKDNYVVVNKVNGKPSSLVKVKKPKITPIIINRDAQSDYFKNLLKEKVESLKPEYLDFDNDIKKVEISDGFDLKYIENTTNDLFSLMYIIEMGRNQDPELALAMQYLPLLGTNVYSPEKIRAEFYKMGISLKTEVKDDVSMVYISGLERSLHAGLELLEHVMQNAVADKEVLSDLVEGILRNRENFKKDPTTIQRGMVNYAKYGDASAFRNVLSAHDLLSVDPDSLVQRIKDLSSFKHSALYYGSKPLYDVQKLLKSVHKVSENLQDVPASVNYKTLNFNSPRVLFLNYPKSQVDVLFLAKDSVFNQETFITSSIFNEYYGNSMSSVVFQEIREAKALAYSASVKYTAPPKKEGEFFIEGIVSSQSDKMRNAISSLDSLLTTMVISRTSFRMACENVIKSIQSDRIVKQNIFWTCRENKQRGFSYDYRKDQYHMAQTITMEELHEFFKNHIYGKHYTYVVIGNKEDIDMEALNRIAPVEELSLEQIFNF